jgi:hypothetical protein
MYWRIVLSGSHNDYRMHTSSTMRRGCKQSAHNSMHIVPGLCNPLPSRSICEEHHFKFRYGKPSSRYLTGASKHIASLPLRLADRKRHELSVLLLVQILLQSSSLAIVLWQVQVSSLVIVVG